MTNFFSYHFRISANGPSGLIGKYVILRVLTKGFSVFLTMTSGSLLRLCKTQTAFFLSPYVQVAIGVNVNIYKISMGKLVTLEFDFLSDLLEYRAYAKLKTYIVDKKRRLSLTCELSNREIAAAMTFNAIPYFPDEDQAGLCLSDIISTSIHKGCDNVLQCIPLK